MIANDVVFLAQQERHRNGMDVGAQQDACIRFRSDGFFAIAEEINGTAEVFLRRIEEGPRRQDIRIGFYPFCRHPVGKIDNLIIISQIHGLTVEIAFIVHEVRLIVDDGRFGPDFGTNIIDGAFFAGISITMFNVTDVMTVELDFTDFDVGLFTGLDIGQEIDVSAGSIAVKNQVYGEVAVVSGLDAELTRNLRDSGADRIIEPYGAFLTVTNCYGTACIAFIESLFEIFFIGPWKSPSSGTCRPV